MFINTKKVEIMQDIKIISPYSSIKNGSWLKGNTHTHSTKSDGKLDQQKVIEIYCKLGYDFLAISDHDKMSNYKGIDDFGLTLLPANEITGNGSHVHHLGSWGKINAIWDRQEVINDINNNGGISVLNHPNWLGEYNHFSIEDLSKLKNYIGIEIFNYGCVHNKGSAYALDKWDQILAMGKYVLGFATDDAHAEIEMGGGWINVYSESNSEDSILRSIKKGAFYSSTGCIIEKIECKEDEISIYAPGVQLIEIIGSLGEVLESFKTDSCTYKHSNYLMHPYFRVQCSGSENTFAWTQVFYTESKSLDGFLDERAIPNQMKIPSSNILYTPFSEKSNKLFNDILPSSLFYDYKTGYKTSEVTFLRSYYAENKLVLNVECLDNDMKGLRCKTKENGLDTIWTDDSLEFFFDIEGYGKNYNRIVLNPLGFYSITSSTGIVDLDFFVNNKITNDRWIIELIVNLKGGKDLFENRKDIPFHLSRHTRENSSFFLWSWVGDSNYTPSKYGKLILEK